MAAFGGAVFLLSARRQKVSGESRAKSLRRAKSGSSASMPSVFPQSQTSLRDLGPAPRADAEQGLAVDRSLRGALCSHPLSGIPPPATTLATATPLDSSLEPRLCEEAQFLLDGEDSEDCEGGGEDCPAISLGRENPRVSRRRRRAGCEQGAVGGGGGGTRPVKALCDEGLLEEGQRGASGGALLAAEEEEEQSERRSFSARPIFGPRVFRGLRAAFFTMTRRRALLLLFGLGCGAAAVFVSLFFFSSLFVSQRPAEADAANALVLQSAPQGTFSSPWTEDADADEDDGGAAAAQAETETENGASGAEAGAASSANGRKQTPSPRRPLHSRRRQPSPHSQGVFFLQHQQGYTAAASMPAAKPVDAAAAAQVAKEKHGGSFHFLLAAPLSSSAEAVSRKTPVRLAGGGETLSSSGSSWDSPKPPPSLDEVALPVPFAKPPSADSQNLLLDAFALQQLSLGTRGNHLPEFSVLRGESLLVSPKFATEASALEEALATEAATAGPGEPAWRGEIAAFTDFNNDLHLDIVFLGSRLHLPSCVQSAKALAAVSSPRRKEASSSPRLLAEAEPASEGAALGDRASRRGFLSSADLPPECGSVVSVYTWNAREKRFEKHSSVNLRRPAEALVAVDWTLDGRVDFVAISRIPRPDGEPGHGFAFSALVQRRSGALEEVWDSVEFSQMLLNRRKRKSAQQDPSQHRGAGGGEGNFREEITEAAAARHSSSTSSSENQQGAAVSSTANAAPQGEQGVLVEKETSNSSSQKTTAPIETREAALSPQAAVVIDQATASLSESAIKALAVSSVHPLLADLNFDHFPDLLVQTLALNSTDKATLRFEWRNLAALGFEGFAPFLWQNDVSNQASGNGGKDRQEPLLPEETASSSPEHFITDPHSSALADIDGDCKADLLLVSALPSSQFSLSFSISVRARVAPCVRKRWQQGLRRGVHGVVCVADGEVARGGGACGRDLEETPLARRQTMAAPFAGRGSSSRCWTVFGRGLQRRR